MKIFSAIKQGFLKQKRRTKFFKTGVYQNGVRGNLMLFLAFIFFAVALVGTFLLWQFAKTDLDKTQRVRLEKSAEVVVATVNERIKNYIDILHNSRALFIASEVVTRKEWSAFLNNIRLSDRYRGISSINYVQRIHAAEAPQFVSAVRSDTTIDPNGYPNFKIFPEINKEEYWVVTYIEPQTPERLAQLGFDLSSESQRFEALMRARDIGKSAATAPVLARTTGKPALFIFLPVFDINAPIDTEDARQSAAQGAVMIVLRLEELFDDIFKNKTLLPRGEFTIADAVAEKENAELAILYKKQNGFLEQRGQQFVLYTDTIDVAGRTWVLNFKMLPAIDASFLARNMPSVLLGGGILFSIILFFVFFVLSVSHSRALRLAKDMSLRFRVLVQSIGDGVIAVDEHGKMIFVNARAEDMIGLKSREMIGKNFRKVVRVEYENGDEVPQEQCPLFVSLIKRELTSSPLNKTYYFVKKDKTRFPIAITSAPCILDQNIVGAIGVFRDVTSEKATDRAKSEFISIASHQLRSPLASSKWILESLLGDARLNEHREKLNDLFIANERLINLMNDLLNISRIESGAQTINKKSVKVLDLIPSCIEAIKLRAEKKGQKINVRVSAESYASIIDPTLFCAAFNNILDNATSYVYNNSDIDVRVHTQDDQYVIAVHNNGPVIKEEDRTKLFKKFYRSEEAQRLKPDGSGLGLFIAKSFIEANGGRIWYESSEAKGTTFYFTVSIK